MVTKREDGGAAMPTGWIIAGTGWLQDGMTLRDYMATHLAAGWLASFPDDTRHPVVSGSADTVAQCSYALADAMLEARK